MGAVVVGRFSTYIVAYCLVFPRLGAIWSFSSLPLFSCAVFSIQSVVLTADIFHFFLQKGYQYDV